MLKKDSKLISCLLVMGFVLFAIQGCAVLTKEQIQAVNEFAKAGEHYTEIPTTVIETHAEIMYLDNIYETASTDLASVESVPDQIDKALKIKNDLLEQADKTKKILNVIDVYISLLKKLTSDVFSEKLAKNTTKLCKELDNAIEGYNDIADSDQTKLNAWGKYIVAGIQGAGGIFIKTKQTKSLKIAVENAEPQLEKISEALTKFMLKYSETLGPYAVEGLTMTYMTLITNDISRNTVESIKDFTEAREKAKSIKTLSEKSIKVIELFQKAHSKLHENLQKKRSIKGSISEIKSLADEIKGAQKIMKDFK